jgi:hypothetical protein
MRKTPGQLERGANLGRGMGRVVFQDLDGSDHMPEALEVAQEPGPEQVLGAGSAAPSAVAGIVWNKQKLNIHETNPSNVRRLTPRGSAAGGMPAASEFYDPLPATGSQHPRGARRATRPPAATAC